MHQLSKSRPLNLIFAILFALSIVASACGASGDGGPAAPGQYSVQKDSIAFDGERYQLYWADTNGSLHRMDTRKLRLVRDPERTFLEVQQGGGDPTLHMREDEPIAVRGQDRQGSFSSPWFPFFAGALVGNMLGGGFGGRGGGQTVIINNPAPGERSHDASSPAYRYPPTGSFGRDEQLHGTLDSSKPQTPDYNKVQPSPYATSAKASGTGGGTAASNKAPGGASGVTGATSGQTGGTGAGGAASGKGGFASGSQSFSNRDPGASSSGGSGSKGIVGGGGSGAGSTGGAGNAPSTGGSGGKGIGGSKPSGGGGGRR
jgi:hypothetical protein